MRAVQAFTIAWFYACVAGAADRMPELERVVASERAFAARAQQVNARQAFVEYFAPGALLYAPFAAPAFPRLREAPDWGVNIQWRPAAAAVSGAGDMGYTTGPAEYRRKPGEVPVGYGHYTSVWQRQPDGSYLVVIDVGIEHPAPATPVADWSPPARAPAGAPVLGPDQQSAARGVLLEVDARLGQGNSAAFAVACAEDARWHRDGTLPIVGRDAVLAALAARAETLQWAPEGAAVAASGDFGYTYGRGRWRGPAGAGDIAYLNVWQKHADVWRLLVHVTKLADLPR